MADGAGFRQWLPALSGMTCLGFGAGLIGVYGFFVEPLSREFDVGVATINIGPVALLLVPGIVAPLVGTLVDRLPARRLVLTGATLAMLSLCAISRAPQLWMAGLGFLCFALGLTLYGPVVINGLMVKTYPGREARALAIAAMGISMAGALLPPVIGLLLAAMDWRQALLSLALGLVLILWIVAFAGIPATAGGMAGAGEEKPGAELYRRREFWLIGLCVALGFNVTIVLSVCYPPHFVSRGFSVADAGWFLSVAGLAGLAGKGLFAWLADLARNYAKWVAAGLLLLQVLGLGLLLRAEATAQVIPAVALLGMGTGAFLPAHPYLNSCYFRPEIIGRVNGAQMPLFLPFGLVGAPLAGYVYDRTGNYDPVFTGLLVVLCIGAVLALLLPRTTGR